MRSLFSVAQFKRFDLGHHVLGQRVTAAPQSAFSITDYLNKVGLDAGDIDKIQDPKFKEEAKADYEKCKTKGLDTAEGLACIAALGVKVYAKLKEEESRPAAPVVVSKPQESFPWIPVGLGVVAAGGLVYFLATRGKK
jgi:hypothetical protein